MTSRLLALLTAGLLAAAPSALSAQLSSHLIVAGGISMPMGTLGDNADAGYNVAAGLDLGAPLIPVGIRLEGGYNGYSFKNSVLANGSIHIISGTANAVLSLGPTGASPYLIGGVGFYSSGGTGSNGNKTVAGVNGGGGIRFPLGVMTTFIEARYHQMLGNANDGTDFKFVPITFGVSF
jgi:hypothetical protein